jgi:hypothetical protein
MIMAILIILEDGAMRNTKSLWRPLNFSERIGNKVQQYVGTRSSAQSRSHAQKVLNKSYYSKSSSVEFTPREDSQVDNENFEEIINKEQQIENSINNIEESRVIKTPINSPK